MINENSSDTISKDMPYIFPKDLDSSRYIVFDFYAPEFVKKVVEGLENVINIAATSTGVGEAFSKIGSEVASVAGTVADQLSTSVKDRVKIKKGKVTADVSTLAIKQNSKTY